MGDGDIEEGEDVTFNDQNENDTDTTDLVPHSNIHKFNSNNNNTTNNDDDLMGEDENLDDEFDDMGTKMLL